MAMAMHPKVLEAKLSKLLEVQSAFATRAPPIVVLDPFAGNQIPMLPTTFASSTHGIGDEDLDTQDTKSQCSSAASVVGVSSGKERLHVKYGPLLSRIHFGVVVFFGIIIVASGGLLFLLLVGLVKPENTDFWIEINSQILNAIFTLATIAAQPPRLRTFWSLYKTIPRDRRRLAAYFLLNLNVSNDVGSNFLVLYAVSHHNCHVGLSRPSYPTQLHCFHLSPNQFPHGCHGRYLPVAA